jgi:hypothetical protein
MSEVPLYSSASDSHAAVAEVGAGRVVWFAALNPTPYTLNPKPLTPIPTPFTSTLNPEP